MDRKEIESNSNIEDINDFGCFKQRLIKSEWPPLLDVQSYTSKNKLPCGWDIESFHYDAPFPTSLMNDVLIFEVINVIPISKMGLFPLNTMQWCQPLITPDFDGDEMNLCIDTVIRYKDNKRNNYNIQKRVYQRQSKHQKMPRNNKKHLKHR